MRAHCQVQLVKELKVTTLGGGTGNSIVLSALKSLNCELATIVNVTDNGGSSGRLRKKLDILPPGDIRQCLITLSNVSDDIKKLFNDRFAKGNLKGHAFGNIFLASLEKTYGSIEKAIEIASRSLDISAKIIPATLVKSNLCLKVDGKIIFGERKIYNTKIANLKKTEFFLKPKAIINPAAAETIEKTDYLIISPGNLYCSLMPILLTDGMAKTIKKSRAKIILIPNLANIKNHTDNFSLENYIEIFSYYLTKLPDFVIINNDAGFVNKHSPNGKAVIMNPPCGKTAGYLNIFLSSSPVTRCFHPFVSLRETSGHPPSPSSLWQDHGVFGRKGIKNENNFHKNFPGVKIIKKDLVQKKLYEKDKNDALERTIVRHDPVKLKMVIKKICGL